MLIGLTSWVFLLWFLSFCRSMTACFSHQCYATNQCFMYLQKNTTSLGEGTLKKVIYIASESRQHMSYVLFHSYNLEGCNNIFTQSWCGKKSNKLKNIIKYFFTTCNFVQWYFEFSRGLSLLKWFYLKPFVIAKALSYVVLYSPKIITIEPIRFI